MIRILTKMATWTRRSEANFVTSKLLHVVECSVKNPPCCETCSYGYFVGFVSKLLHQFQFNDPFKGQVISNV